MQEPSGIARRPSERTISTVRWAVALAPFLAASPALAQDPPASSAPVLRINSPFAAPLWRLDVDRDETTFVSSSAYKAVTIWPLANPSAVRFARVPLRNEQRRRAHGVAIAPDGETIAYSVPPLVDASGTAAPGTARIYIMRQSDGFILKTIDADVPTRPQALKFSPDGTYLAAVLSSGCGLRVWTTDTWSLASADDEGYAGSVPAAAKCCPAGNAAECDALPDTTGLAFAEPAAAPYSLITAGDTGLRTYSLQGGRFVRKLFAPSRDIGLERPEGVAVSPDGRSIAVADRRERGAEASDKPIVLRIAVLALDTLRPVRAPFEISADSPALAFPAYLDPVQVPDARLFSLHRVTWMEERGQQWIVAGGFFACEAARADLRVRPVETRQDVCLVRWSASRPSEPPRFIPIGTDRVMDILPLKKSGALLVASQNAIAAVNLEGEPIARPDGGALAQHNLAADFRDGARPFRISADAKSVYIEDYRSRPEAPVRLLFNAEALTLDEAPQETPGLAAPNQDPNILSDPGTQDPRRRQWWRNTEGPPRFLRQPVVDPRLDKDDIYRSVALDLDKRIAVLGSANFLRVIGFGDGPPRILCQLPIAEEAYRVNMTADATLIVAGHSDGVLRWYRYGAVAGGCRLDLVLSVYITRTAAGEWTWIAWVPSGEFANDPRALNLMSWQVVEASGKVKTVDFSQLLGWYKRDSVAAAVHDARVRPAIADTGGQLSSALQQAIAAKAGQQILEIVSRIERVDTERFRYRVRVADAASWPKRLSVRTGEGHKALLAHGPAGADIRGVQPEPEVRVDGPGLVELDLLLPPAVRTAAGAVDLCFFFDDVLQACRAIHWAGPLVPPPPRRLWAVIVGFSKYDHAELNLSYAQNDALDLARLFVQDYQKRAGSGRTDTPSDFASIHIDLVVAPSNPMSESELAKLAELPYVKRRPASRDGILQSLQDLVDRSRTGDFMNDLFVFYFSGHGFAHPTNTERGKTALATPLTNPNLSALEVVPTTLASDSLIDLIDKIGAQKLVIIDACRTPPSTPRYTPFQAGALTQEFAARALTTYFYFSARDGQYSIEQPDYFFDSMRPAPMRGNGLFTFGLLKALMSGEAEPNRPIAGKRRLDTEDVMRYIESHVFDLRNPDSIARHLERIRGRVPAQTPIYVVARPDLRLQAGRHLVLRTID